ncbi:GNAT family N-acetyltransferase [Thalassotalea agarivorans]|uniref:Ribosomal protein S18 acetylase RimI n=1 Tax=Thalassotalea agarivorans TaxID=349064 RepID=A0A1I0ANT2_THASX|nr:GNAT family N-acetyltransferase [Thalassotalea agarivorans]SES96022.1 Ribosomal protein S18 acetylase RimI [Thalassotalea agarivorans]
MQKTIEYRQMEPEDFERVIALGNFVHGDGYLTKENLASWYTKGIKNDINANFVAYDQDKLVGFRITYANEQWHIDNWNTPDLWQVEPQHVAYFKCATVDSSYRGYGLGKSLLNASIDQLKLQGAQAGVAHLWKQSPNNSAVAYFERCGGKHVKSHPDKWREDALAGYECILCGFDCHCEAAEMIIYF